MMNLATGGFENGGRAQSGGRTLHNLLRIGFALFLCADAGGAAQGQRVDVPMVFDRRESASMRFGRTPGFPLSDTLEGTKS